MSVTPGCGSVCVRADCELAVIGDVHGRRQFLDQVLAAIEPRGVDGVLLVGDLGSRLSRHRIKEGERRRYLRAVEGVVEAVRGLGVPLAYVPGNHDLPDLDFEGNADGRALEVAGVSVVGIGGSTDRFGDPYERSEASLRALELPPAEVLLTHVPPARTPLDWVPHRERHVGSEAIRERAETHSGVLVCGHIHESAGAAWLGDCLCLNAGGLGRPFGRPQVGFIRRSEGSWEASHLDLSSGVIRSWVR